MKPIAKELYNHIDYHYETGTWQEVQNQLDSILYLDIKDELCLTNQFLFEDAIKRHIKNKLLEYIK